MKNRLSFRDIADLTACVSFMALTIWFILSTFSVVKLHAMSTSSYVPMLTAYAGYFTISKLTRNDNENSE